MMRSALPFLVLLLLAAAGPLSAATITTEDSGELQFLLGSDVYSSACAGAFGPGCACYMAMGHARELSERPDTLSREDRGRKAT